jgi:hypothetical protein
MTWVRLDDRFPSHRKVALLSDRAFRLHVSAICWCAENLTDGHIGDRELALITRIRSVRATAKELQDAGVWDRVGDSWVIHDYLEYNPSREQVLLERKKNAERQERFRRRKNGKPTPPSNGRSNGVTPTSEMHDGDTTATRRTHDGDTNAPRNESEEHAEAEVNEFRNGVTNGAPSRPVPSPTPYMADVDEKSAGSRGLSEQRSDDRPAFDAPIDDDGFTLTDTMRRWVAASYPQLDVEYVTAQFVSHYRGTGAHRKSWPDAWQKWVRTEAKHVAERQQRQPSNVVQLSSSQRPGGIRDPLPTADEINNLTLKDVL